MADFIPILLGTDINAYGTARAFHEAYQIKSIALGKQAMLPTRYSSIVSVEVTPGMDEQEGFMKKLDEIARRYEGSGKKLILIACGDSYVELIVKNKEALKDRFVVPYIDLPLLERLVHKDGFYQTCEEYGLPYPKTARICKENYREAELPFDFPVAVKAADSISYYHTSFPGKKKAYIVESKAEFDRVVEAIYSSSYEDDLIIQDYIPGEDKNMRVLNAYVGKDGKVRLMCMGRPLLEDHSPASIGNYLAIINEFDLLLCDKVERYLTGLGYIGFANFDMKYDTRDGKHKFLEINLRQGRSSYFVTGSGYNIAKFLVEDWIENKPQPLVHGSDPHLWLGVPKRLLLKYMTGERLKKQVKKLIKEKKVCHTLFYKKDFNLYRWFRMKWFYFEYYSQMKKYYGKRGMEE